MRRELEARKWALATRPTDAPSIETSQWRCINFSCTRTVVEFKQHTKSEGFAGTLESFIIELCSNLIRVRV